MQIVFYQNLVMRAPRLSYRCVYAYIYVFEYMSRLMSEMPQERVGVRGDIFVLSPLQRSSTVPECGTSVC